MAFVGYAYAMPQELIQKTGKALFVTMEFWPFRGGVARYYKNFCDAWVERQNLPFHPLLRKEGTEENGGGLTVYVVEGAPESRVKNRESRIENQDDDAETRRRVQSNDADYRVIRKKSYWKWMRPRWGKLLIDLFFYVKQHKPSVVFVGHLLPIGLIAFLLQKLFRFDYVVFLHGLDVQFAHRGRRHRRFVINTILRDSCSIIVNSEYTKREAVKVFGIEKQKVMVLLPKAFSTNNKQQTVISSEALAESRNLTNEGFANTMRSLRYGRDDKPLPIILSAGRLVPRKGFDDVIQVAKHFVGKAKFIIFGRGPEEKNTRSSIIDNHLESTVQLITDSVSDGELSELYDACDIFLFLPKELPGGDVEGFGQVALEAEAHGKPVVVRSSGGSGEALIDTETGYLVNSLEACGLKLEALLGSEELRMRMGERGREFAATVSKDFDEQVSGLKKALLEQTKKVSVVIPVGYDTKRIKYTLQSLERQTYKHFEVIIIGDGIPLEHLNVTSYKLQATSYKIMKSGAAAARNAGAKQATGDYLLFVDDDTVLRKDCIEKMVRRHEAGKLQITNYKLQINSKTQNPNEQIQNRKQATSYKLQATSFVYSGFRMGWKTLPAVPFNRETAYQYPYFDVTSMIRRDAFPGFDESLKRLQDWDLFLTILDNGGSGEPIHEILYFKSARLFKNLIKWKGISFWFPKFVWKLPVARSLYSRLAPVRKYHNAVINVQMKHQRI